MSQAPSKHAGSFQWTIALNVDCPHCDETFDANVTDAFHEQLTGVEICEAKKGCQVECPECHRDFVFNIDSGC